MNDVDRFHAFNIRYVVELSVRLCLLSETRYKVVMPLVTGLKKGSYLFVV